MLRKIKTIRSHVGLARWLAETEDKPEWLARVQVEDIPSPYAYSPTVCILRWHGGDVCWFETSHKVYEVFEVPANLLRFRDEEKAYPVFEETRVTGLAPCCGNLRRPQQSRGRSRTIGTQTGI